MNITFDAQFWLWHTHTHSVDWPGGAFFEDDDGVAEKFLAGDGCGALLLVRGELSCPYMEDIFSLY